MSKSKGDFLTVSLIESKGYNPLIYRFFCLQSHYRKPLVFSYEALDQAKATYLKLVKKIASLKAEGEVDNAFVKSACDTFADKVGNDMNTALGITCIYDILKADTTDASKLAAIDKIDSSVLCVGLLDAAKEMKKEAEKPQESSASADISPELKEKIESLIAERAMAKREKNFARADEIRQELDEMGIVIKDTREGTVYTLKA